MVLGILIATITAPGLLGSQEAIRQSQSKEKREEHRARRCNLIVTCVKSSSKSREIDGRQIVLRNGRLWIDTETEDGNPLGHPYAGYYLPYPDSKYEGLVTTITDVAPIMNWVYVDRETHEVRYGVRADAQSNLTGPFDCTRQDRRLTFDGWEGWCAVEEIPGLWALYFDVNDDGLMSKVQVGARVLEIELRRKEKRFKKEAEARQQDQTTKRVVDPTENEPVDQPLGPEALVQRPGVVDTEPTIADRGESKLAEEEETTKPRPFMIPKSIFNNPPPMLEGSVFQRPLTPDTPPPAYSTNPRPVTPTPDTDTGADTGLPQPNTTSTPSASPPTALRRDPVHEKHTTPKLNRSSGTRALAQAQMFEAMAAGQIPKNDLQMRTSRRSSRASSNADSNSQYSNDGLEVPPFESKKATLVSPTPLPLVLTLSKDNNTTLRTDKIRKPPTRSLGNKSAQDPAIPLRSRPTSGIKDPAVFGTATTKTANSPSIRRPTLSRGSPTPPVLRSRSSSRVSNESPRTLQRQMTAPVQTPSTSINNSTRSTSVSGRGTVRKSLATTMTTGRPNQGMKSRVGSGAGRGSPGLAPGRAATVRDGARNYGRKTTSALFREIDELVGQENK